MTYKKSSYNADFLYFTITYYDDKMGEIERELASKIHREVLKQMQGLKDPDEPVYHMTEDQYCIQMGVRCPGESYPTAKDKAVWEHYERKRKIPNVFLSKF